MDGAETMLDDLKRATIAAHVVEMKTTSRDGVNEILKKHAIKCVTKNAIDPSSEVVMECVLKKTRRLTKTERGQTQNKDEDQEISKTAHDHSKIIDGKRARWNNLWVSRKTLLTRLETQGGAEKVFKLYEEGIWRSRQS